MRKVNLGNKIAFADFQKYEVGQMYADKDNYQIVVTVEEAGVQDTFGGYTSRMWLHTFRPATLLEIEEYLKPVDPQKFDQFWSDFFDATETM